ncbi:MAG: hypothetical protein IID33_14445, partial [Planctomycetes bacterium]|nr:hypothetical protein [Planctomycetota bacterium]
LRPERLRDIYHAEFEVLDTAAGPRIIVPRLWSDSPAAMADSGRTDHNDPPPKA